MAECFLTMAVGDNSGASGNSNSIKGFPFRKKMAKWGPKKVVGLKLDILGETLDFHIGLCKERAKLADIVPPARALCDKITEIVLRRISSDGGNIPCGEGCSACCKRCLVPVSVPEALRFKEEIIAEPASRRESVWQACLQAARLILRQRPPESFIDQTDESSSMQSVDIGAVSNWYTSLNLSCPFLYNNVCGIYEQRPLACREHFIKGSSAACRGQSSGLLTEGGVAEVIEMPVQLPNVLGRLASELEGEEMESVILPLALVWCQENPERAERTWPAEMMVRRFIEIVESMARRNMPAAAVLGTPYGGRRNSIIGISKKRRAANQLCRLSSG